MKQLQARNELAYQEIKHRIINMTYKMRQPLTEEILAEELGLSRTPVRQALRQLEAEDFVQILPYRGCVVRELTPQDVQEIYVIRGELERVCVRTATTLINQANLQLLEDSWAQSAELLAAGEQVRSVVAGTVLHTVCIKIGGGRRIGQILNNLAEQVRRLDHISFNLPGRLAQSIEEHRQITDAIRARDLLSAEKLMRDHILGTGDDVVIAMKNDHTSLYY